MAKLNQLIAASKTVKADAGRTMTDAYHAIQKTPLLAGQQRTYQPREDGGEALPGELQRVQVKVPDILTDVEVSLVKLFDLACTMDTTNQNAKADIVIGDNTIASDIPVSTLLFLEKQLTDLHTFVKKLPLLDSAESWTTDQAQEGVWRSEPVKTQRSKKVPRNHVKAKATDKHAEQVEVYFEDVVVGDWTTVKFSGAIPHAQARELLRRVNTLQVAVKQAREKANMTEVIDHEIGESITRYLFG